jgi:N-acetylmuramoyl-L-alanine amidase
MKRFQVLLAVGLLIGMVESADASSKDRYQRAQAQERGLRLGARPSPLSHIRRAVDAYETVVRRSPGNGYADNALWQGARLAFAAHRIYRSEVDRQDGIRLLQWLVREYPSSSLRPKAAALLKSNTRRAIPTTRADSRRAASREAPSSARHEEAASPAATGPGSVPLAASPSSRTARLLNVRREMVGSTIRLTFEFDSEIVYQQQLLSNPARLYFDMAHTDVVPRLRDASLHYDGPAARRVRLGSPRQDTTRLVVDLEGVERYSVFALYNPYRLAIDLQPPAAAAPPVLFARSATPPSAIQGFAAPSSRRLPSPRPVLTSRSNAPPFAIAAVPPHSRRLPTADEIAFAERKVTPRPLPHPLAGKPVPVARAVASKAIVPLMRPDALAASRPRGLSAMGRSINPPRSRVLARLLVPPAPQVANVTPPPPAPPAPLPQRPTTAPSLPAPMAPVPNEIGGFSLARQLGLGVARIVIDPGHGGHDPGAIGSKVTEAELVLDVALRLEALLRKVPGIEVVLTRRSDVYVPLEERTAIANRQRADLFLSIHANSSRNKKASGIETYFLNFASTPEAEAVAARENAGAARGMNHLPEMVRAIALNNKLDESRDLAKMVQATLASRLQAHNEHIKDLGVKQAPFVVLIGASMPSVLAEVAFISHQDEAALLRTGSYRQEIAESLFEAVQQYQQTLKNSATWRFTDGPVELPSGQSQGRH